MQRKDAAIAGPATNLGFRPETTIQTKGTHFNDDSKKGNDAHGPCRRQHQPKIGRIFIRNVTHLSPI